MFENSLFEYNGLSVDIKERPSNDLLRFLDENEYGTPGGFIYQHTYASHKAKALENTYFFTLRKNDRLLGNIAFCRRYILSNKRGILAFYIRYLTVTPSYRRNLSDKKSLKNKLAQNKKSQGIIKESMHTFFSNAEKYLSQEEKDEKYIFYAHIEDANQRSSMLSEAFGYEKTGIIETTIFSRIFPKRNHRVERIQSGDKEKVLELLSGFYEGHSMYTRQNLFYKDNYFLLKKDGEIIAGVQANVITWKIKYMPGLSGKIVLKLLPYIPLFSRLFNPDCFRFLAFESLYVKKGHEKEINRLFESVCAEFKIHISLMWTDLNGPLHKIIKKYINLGVFQKVSKNMTAGIYVKFINFTPDEKLDFCTKPAYVSAFDLT